MSASHDRDPTQQAPTKHALVNLQRQRLPSFVQLSANLRDVVALNVSNCGLQSLDGIGNLAHLELLVASGNSIVSLKPLDCLHRRCCHLELLYLDNNLVSDITELGWLAGTLTSRMLSSC